MYIVEATLAAITVLSLTGYNAKSLAHLYLGSFSHSSLQILSSYVRLDWERCRIAIFWSLQMFDRVQVRALTGPLKDIQRLEPKPLLHCLGWVLRVMVLLEGDPSLQSEVLSRFSSISVLCSVHLSLNPD